MVPYHICMLPSTMRNEDCYKTFTNHRNVRVAAGHETTQTPEDTSLNYLIRNGVASILVFRSKAPHLLKLVDDKDDTDVTTIAKVIKKECSTVSIEEIGTRLDCPWKMPVKYVAIYF
ncbi:hypothetical protein GWK47_020234 [Chionoecetes opilio]|uniref:Uncharacterized protein n=1 Tax=Chionoecetes opilio TaxID=41210 RepID=A0A8J4XTX5_CHIOP|nr:hypothetical protein GWK47_020234 [Chionoecetes opilio]